MPANRKVKNLATGEITTYYRYGREWLKDKGKMVKNLRGAEIRMVGYELIQNSKGWEVIG